MDFFGFQGFIPCVKGYVDVSWDIPGVFALSLFNCGLPVLAIGGCEDFPEYFQECPHEVCNPGGVEEGIRSGPLRILAGVVWWRRVLLL